MTQHIPNNSENQKIDPNISGSDDLFQHITQTEIHLHTYNNDSYEHKEISELSEIAIPKRSKQYYWIDIVGLHDVAIITSLCESLNIHPLAIEDILNTHQRTKIDRFDDHILVNLKVLPLAKLNFKKTEQISIIVKHNIIISIRESRHLSYQSIYERLKKPYSDIRTRCLSYFLYVLIDNIVDHYFNMCHSLEDRINYFEKLICEQPRDTPLNTFYQMKRKTIQIRKVVRQLFDTTEILLKEPFQQIKPEHHFYFRDLFDHSARLMDEVEVYREIVQSLLEIHLSNLNNAMNETMRILTIFASVFIPMTFLCSIYGMNFDYMPELHWKYSYPIIWCVFIVMGIIAYIYFKRKKWL